MNVVDAARGYMRTPFHHQGRVKGVGVDCIGLIVCAAKEVGIELQDVTNYSSQPDGASLIRELQGQLDEVPFDEAEPGDVLVFWFTTRDYPQHVALKTEVGMIHTFEKVKMVCEHALDDYWLKRKHTAFRFRRST